MGQQLYHTQPTYKRVVDEADQIFRRIAGFSILAEMLKSEDQSTITATVHAQPANLLIQIGITELLNERGVAPGALVGHSVGELASAYIANVLSLEDVLRVSYHRSQLQAETEGQGTMLAVGLGKEEALQRIEDCTNLVSLAAVNGPNSSTLAGFPNSLRRIEADLKSAGIFARLLDVDIPYHSPMMDPLLRRLESALEGMDTSAPTIPLYSTVTGKQIQDPSYGAAYWPQNIRQPVEFESAVTEILAAGFNTFIEIGPHPVLASSLLDCIKAAGADCRLIQTLRRSIPEESQSVQRAAMQVFAAGCDIDWQAICPSSRFVALPTYQWQREKHWSENSRATQDRINPIVYPILGTQEALAAPVWRNDFDHQPLEYLRDHVVSKLPILPAAAYLESLLELASIQFPEAAIDSASLPMNGAAPLESENGFASAGTRKTGLAVRNLEIRAPLLISVERGLDYTSTLDRSNFTVSIRGQENGKLGIGSLHASAVIAEIDSAYPEMLSLDNLKAKNREPVDIQNFYQELNQNGLSYGPRFQTVRQLFGAPREHSVLAEIVLDPALENDLSKYRLHPTMLDGCFQSLMAMLDLSTGTYLPTHLGELCLYQKQQQTPFGAWVHLSRKRPNRFHVT